jgi:hypothetical protein
MLLVVGISWSLHPHQPLPIRPIIYRKREKDKRDRQTYSIDRDEEKNTKVPCTVVRDDGGSSSSYVSNHHFTTLTYLPCVSSSLVDRLVPVKDPVGRTHHYQQQHDARKHRQTNWQDRLTDTLTDWLTPGRTRIFNFNSSLTGNSLGILGFLACPHISAMACRYCSSWSFKAVNLTCSL